MYLLHAKVITLVTSCLLCFDASASEWTKYSIELSVGPVMGTDELRGTERAYYKFIGGEDESSTNAPSASSGNSSSGSTITIKDGDEEIQFRRTKQRIVKQITISADRPIASNLSVRLATGGSTSNSRYYFDEGIGALIDPITLRYAENRVSFKLGLKNSRTLLYNLTTDTEIGAIQQFQWSKTRISSALIDVTDSHYASASGLYALLQVGHARFPVLGYVEFDRLSSKEFLATAGLRVAITF